MSIANIDISIDTLKLETSVVNENFYEQINDVAKEKFA